MAEPGRRRPTRNPPRTPLRSLTWAPYVVVQPVLASLRSHAPAGLERPRVIVDGRRQVLEPITFDYQKAQQLTKKATTWIGRLVSLGTADFQMTAVVAPPARETSAQPRGQDLSRHRRSRRVRRVATLTGLVADLEEFAYDHHPHGPLTADATPPAWNGYLLTMACPCGVVFERRMTPPGCRTGSAARCVAALSGHTLNGTARTRITCLIRPT